MRIEVKYWKIIVFKVLIVLAEIKTNQIPFLFLALDLPPAPLYQDEAEKNIIPQVPLTTILQKYDGKQVQV